jgi:hypothetical protein
LVINAYPEPAQVVLRDAYENRGNQKLVRRYVFAYNTQIQGSDTTDGDPQTEANKKTTTLFDKVQLKNAIENEIDKSTENVVVRYYAIQGSKLLENGVDLAEDLTPVNLAKIYDMFIKQNSKNNDTTGLKVDGLRDADLVTTTEDGASGTNTQHVNRWDTTAPGPDDPTNPSDHVKP